MSWGFNKERLGEEELNRLKELGRLARGDILKMTTVAGSGHPGGSMSSIDIYLTLYHCANIYPDNPNYPERDRIVISHGHTSPGVYAALGRLGFFDLDSVISGFRKTGSIFEGHIERDVPGVEWSTGNLGQGLSAGCGFALAARVHKKNWQVFVVMGDGEQAKGQIGEARRFARKHTLTNITVIIDYNRIQLSGPLSEIMPQNIKENYQSDGWEVLEIDGHNYQEIYQALGQAVRNEKNPVMILAHTTMSKGISFMEDKCQFHGMPLSLEQCREALSQLNLEDDLEKYIDLRQTVQTEKYRRKNPLWQINFDTGQPITYKGQDKMDNRGAFGRALEDLGEKNCGWDGRTPMVVLDCDLLSSVKTNGFADSYSTYFFEAGIQEHNTATVAGALSVEGIITFFADFGVFGVDETYNQHRLNDINKANLKLICTHNGIDVGQDGKTHQCIDYVGIMRNLYGYKIIIPADPNQTDRAVRYLATQPGNFLLAAGRSKLPAILSEEGEPFFAGDYQFEYGKADLIRDGEDGAIIASGGMVHRAVKAGEILRERGYRVKVINVSCLSKLDRSTLQKAAETGVVVTYEDHNIHTGLGSIIADFLAENSLNPRFRKLGVVKYSGSGKPDELFKLQGLDVETLVDTVARLIKSE